MRTDWLESLSEVIRLDRSCWLRLLPQERRGSLVAGLKHEIQRGWRLALAFI